MWKMLYGADGRELGWCLMTLPLPRVAFVPAHNAYFAWSQARQRYERVEPATCNALPAGQTPLMDPVAFGLADDGTGPED